MSPNITPSDEMWDDASHPGWDAYEAGLDQMPLPAATSTVTFGSRLDGFGIGVTTLSLFLGRFFGKKKYLLDVFVWQRKEPVRYGVTYQVKYDKQDRDLVIDYCHLRFQRAGRTIDAIHFVWSGAGIRMNRGQFTTFRVEITTK